MITTLVNSEHQRRDNTRNLFTQTKCAVPCALPVYYHTSWQTYVVAGAVRNSRQRLIKEFIASGFDFGDRERGGLIRGYSRTGILEISDVDRAVSLLFSLNDGAPSRACEALALGACDSTSPLAIGDWLARETRLNGLKRPWQSAFSENGITVLSADHFGRGLMLLTLWHADRLDHDPMFPGS